MKLFRKCLLPSKTKLLAAAAAAASTSAFSLPPFVDMVVLMDESTSMTGEQRWMAATIPRLDTGLNDRGVAPNRYGLVGFGASVVVGPLDVRSFRVGGGQFGTAADYAAASSGLLNSGSYEDGYAAIALANTYTLRDTAARNYILVSDEERHSSHVASAAYNYTDTLNNLLSTDTLLNVVVNASFKCGDNSPALGIVGTTGYKADGNGGFLSCPGASFTSGYRTTGDDYVRLALATGGGAWDLNVLRSGGDNATSFTIAFIDGKVAEITAIPEPTTAALIAAGLGVVGWAARRRAV